MKSNVVIIYVDQLARNMLGCYGGTEVSTPNIDALAADGVVLDNFYTPSAVCTPSRGCFMTGNYPFVNGAYKNGKEIGATQRGFAEYFNESGYITGYIGKWHLGKYIEERADLQGCNALGFSQWKYKTEFGHCKSVIARSGAPELSKNVGDENSYTTDWLTTKTIEFINEQTTKLPFLFMVSIPDPHQPFKVRAPYDTMFDPNKMLVPNSFFEKHLPDWAENDEWGRNHYFPMGLFDRVSHFQRLKAQYLGEIKCIDDNVGRIVQALKQQNMYQNTIICFTTDHGDYMGEHGLVEKNNLYESVYHLPLIICCPQKLDSGKRRDSYIDTVDFAKTICSLADIPQAFECDGTDCSALILSDIACRNDEIYIHPSDVPRAGILTRQYELAYVGKGFDTDTIFKDHILFDRINDTEQTDNLFNRSDMQELISHLTGKIKAHHKKLKTPLEFLPKEVWYE